MSSDSDQREEAATASAAPYRGFIESFRVCFFQKYADFSGRASRSEFFYFYLAQIVIGVCVLTSIQIMYGEFPVAAELALQAIFLLPFLAVGVRRMHDIGNSGALWIVTYIWSQLMLIPGRYDYIYELVGSELHLLIVAVGTVLIIFCLLDLARRGEAKMNSYG